MEADALLKAGIDATDAKKGAREFNNAVDDMEKKARTASDSIGGMDMDGFMAGAAGGAAVFAMDALMQSVSGLGQSYIQFSDAAQQVENQLSRTTATFEDMQAISQASYASIQDTTKLYVSLDSALKKITDSQEDVLKMTELLNKASVVSGASTDDMSNSMRQLSQAMYGGIVRAEEWNSIMEQTPYVLQIVSQNVEGISGDLGKLRQMMLDGELTAEVFFNAFMKGGKTIEDAFGNMDATISQSFTMLSNSTTAAVKEFNEVTGASSSFAEAIRALATDLDGITHNLSLVADDIRNVQIQYLELKELILANPLTEYIGAALSELSPVKKGIEAISYLWDRLTNKQGENIKIQSAHQKELEETRNKLNELRDAQLSFAGEDALLFGWDDAMFRVVSGGAGGKSGKGVAAKAAEEMKALNAEVAEFDRLLSQAESLKVSLMPEEDRIDYDYNQILKELEMLRREGAISAQEFQTMNEQATVKWVEQWDQALKIGIGKHEKASDDMSQIWIEAYRNMERAASNFFLDAMQGNFDELGASFVKMLQKMLADWAAAQMMMGLFGPTFGKPGGSLGGIIGGMFGTSAAGAAGATGATGPGVSSAPVVNMNITEAPGTTTETTASYSQSQGLTLDIIVQKVEAGISKNVANGRGQLAPTLQGTYGLNRAVNAYR